MNRDISTYRHIDISNSERGFTLVEVLISSFVFSIIVLAVTGLFVQILAVERRSFSAQKIQEDGLFITELMAREIRVSQIQNQDSNCALTSLSIIHPVNGAVTYSLNNGVLQRTAGGVTTDISSSGVTFTRLNFCVSGSGSSDQQQVRVAILIGIQNKTGKETLNFNLQTTVSSRNFQNEF